MAGIKFATCALILNETGTRLLAVSRKDNKEDWGLPGGKCNPGEDIVDCLQREIKEETGLDIINGDFIFGNLSESKAYYVLTYLCQTQGTLHTPEKLAELGEGDLAWKTFADIEKGTFGAYNRHLRYLMEHSSQNADEVKEILYGG